MNILRIKPNKKLGKPNYVIIIKAVRAYTGSGLKEAKDWVDSAIAGNNVELTLYSNAKKKIIDSHDILEAEGFEIIDQNSKIDFILEATTVSAKMAIDENENELAVLLLNVLLTYEKSRIQKIQEREKILEEDRVRKHKQRMRREELVQTIDINNIDSNYE